MKKDDKIMISLLLALAIYAPIPVGVILLEMTKNVLLASGVGVLVMLTLIYIIITRIGTGHRTQK
ncbi:MAG: hypothetical protein AYK18_10210 [Theionarchaea archaeon DG-70]|nr:MAG: hypothetical protein AYK18_10210 [Theionarchaea archaeon DG-70]